MPTSSLRSGPGSGRAAAFVALGILASRLTGLIRQRTFAHYFGLQSDAADAFTAAFRIPNVLQNLFGEGALSASFIPVYSALLARGEKAEASRVAGAVASLLALVTAGLVLCGVAGAPFLVAVIAPGFEGAKHDLTVAIVRILFPGAGLLVSSAWCLGILNSHRRFLLSYIAPVLWNAAMIATLVMFGAASLPELAIFLAWGSVVGSGLQVAVQVPLVIRLVRPLRPSFAWNSVHTRTVIRNFGPAFISRGVVQISAFVDEILATLLPTGSMTALANAQQLYLLPVSLFGMSISAAELPAMAETAASAPSEALRARLAAAVRRLAFFVVPSTVAFVSFGDVIAAAVFETGRFTHDDALFVWGVLAGYAGGLLPSTMGRLYASCYYALHDTRTPLRFAMVRVAVATALGYVAAIVVPPLLGLGREWGTAGLTAASTVAGWMEYLLLRRTLNHRIGVTGLPTAFALQLWGAALASAAAGWLVKYALPMQHPIVVGALVLGTFGGVYLGLAIVMRVPEASGLRRRLR